MPFVRPAYIGQTLSPNRGQANCRKRKKKFMQMTQEKPVDRALTTEQCATALGLAEFSLFSRVQTGDIKAVRARSGEMLIPSGEVERLVNGFANKPSVQDGTILPDSVLGIKTTWGGWSGSELRYRVPALDSLLREDDMPGYRAAASAIAAPLESMKELNRQLSGESRLVESGEINMSPTERWEIRSSLLTLNPGEVLLCQRGDRFSVIERFQDDSPYAKMNGNAQMLWEGNHAKALAGAFKDDARVTLEFMASNLTARAQKIVWEQFPDHRPGHVVAAIVERCHEAIANEETISQKVQVSRGITI
jgi:hypothetical protein